MANNKSCFWHRINKVDFQEIYNLMVDLGKERPIFYSEGDFKVALCQKIASSPEINKKYNFKIRAEFPISYADKSIDIVLIDTENRKYAIELKYLKQKYGEVVYNEESFNFITSDASTEKMFRYYKDVEKLQDLLKKDSRFEKAYAILLTNNDFFYNDKYCLKYEDNDRKVIYQYKKYTENKLIAENAKINIPYKIQWHPYSDKIKDKDGKNIELKFLINEVKK